MLRGSPYPDIGRSRTPELVMLPFPETPDVISELEPGSSSLSQDEELAVNFNTFQQGTGGATCMQQIVCCCFPKGIQRVLYRNRRETLLNMKAISSFVEMIIGAVVMYAVPEGNACDNAKYALLFYMLRLPFELPLLRSALEGFTVGVCTWVFDIMWSVCFFMLGIYLTLGTQCAAEPTSHWIGFIICFGMTPALLFMTWPIVGKLVNDALESWKPILPNLQNERFATFKNKQEDIDEHNNCVICITEFQDENIVTKLPCAHFFHQYCVNQWLKNHNTCPMCRADVPDDGWSPESEEFITADEQLIREIEMDVQAL